MLDPTLTLPTLTALLENVDWDAMGWKIDIPLATLDAIQNSSTDDPECRLKCWEVYTNEHPALSWKHVAEALYWEGNLDRLEVVQKKYLKGWYIYKCESSDNLMHVCCSVAECEC